MAGFITFIEIKAVHSYYDGKPTSFRFRPTGETERLMHNRGVLFIHTANCCQFMLKSDSAGFLSGDKLELTLKEEDNNFMYFTQLNDYRPQTFYRLALSDDSQDINIASAIVATEEKGGESHFCNITIQLTDKMLEDAKAGKSREYLLRFREKAYRWEYVFKPSCMSLDESKTLCLEDTQGKFFFTLSEKYTDPSLSIGTMWRIFSASPIVCRIYRNYHLQLSQVQTAELCKLLSEILSRNIQPEDFSKLPPEVLSDILPKILADKSLKKRIISRFISCPWPGKYPTDEKDCIREICYI